MLEYVRVYKNLHSGKLSIQVKDSNGWRVARHADSVCLYNVKLHVSKAGREKVIAEKRKNVHAWLEGFTCDDNTGIAMVGVRYNPYHNTGFTLADGTIVKRASHANLTYHHCDISLDSALGIA